jgi:hypothetical protein
MRTATTGFPPSANRSCPTWPRWSTAVGPRRRELAEKERAAFASLHTLSKKNAGTRGVSQGIDRYHRLMDAVHHCWFNGMSIVLSHAIQLDAQCITANARIETPAVGLRTKW